MLVGKLLHDPLFIPCSQWLYHLIIMLSMCLWFVSTGGAGGKGVWGAAGMVYEDEEPDMRDPNYDESSQVSEYSRSGFFIKWMLKGLDSHTKLDFCAFLFAFC